MSTAAVKTEDKTLRDSRDGETRRAEKAERFIGIVKQKLIPRSEWKKFDQMHDEWFGRVEK